MMPLTRRRLIRISAAVPGLALLPLGGGEASVPVAAAERQENLHVWHGVALGADATLQLHHPDAAEAHRLIAACLDEVNRLEQIFSLYRPGSALCRLNRDGVLEDPPLEMVELLGRSAEFARLTGHAFDPTVQPLWDLYAAHFSVPSADPNGPPPATIRSTLERIGVEKMIVTPALVRLSRPGMALTLNGIAQGYVTDRVVALLRREGIDRSLVDMGEIRAIGGRPLGGPWVVGLEDPTVPGTSAGRIVLENKAVSTSGGYGTPLGPDGRFNHIFDPATGGTSWRYRAVSVVADTSTTADALSTAFCLLPRNEIDRISAQLKLNIYIGRHDGKWETVNA